MWLDMYRKIKMCLLVRVTVWLKSALTNISFMKTYINHL